ncbi:hypothetical protein [Caballeronia cordobensis]|uniref:hypothetical protein n=1 Tax=Caballeronia cordobensis TaxID=1353886 RepID=UPI0006AD6BDF|nr:hypothetical protein [Caballeronia cordobensis]
MDHAQLRAISVAVPCDYIFVIEYHSAGAAAYIIKGQRSEPDAWRKLATEHDLRGIHSITIVAQPV